MPRTPCQRVTQMNPQRRRMLRRAAIARSATLGRRALLQAGPVPVRWFSLWRVLSYRMDGAAVWSV